MGVFYQPGNWPWNPAAEAKQRACPMATSWGGGLTFTGHSGYAGIDAPPLPSHLETITQFHRRGKHGCREQHGVSRVKQEPVSSNDTSS